MPGQQVFASSLVGMFTECIAAVVAEDIRKENFLILAVRFQQEEIGKRVAAVIFPENNVRETSIDKNHKFSI